MERPVLELLTRYVPSGSTETADVALAVDLAQRSADPWSQSIPVHFTASAVVVHPATRRLLLRWHTRQQAWLQVGGHGDPGESEPIEVALREGREETGLIDLLPWPDASMVHAVICAVPAKGPSPAHQHVDLRFVLRTERPDAIRPERADAPLRWLSLAEAAAATSEDNLRETIDRVEALLGGGALTSA